MAEYTPYPVELITPEGPAYADEAQMVIVPGAAGQLGILANHAPLVSLVDAGEVRITDAGGAVHRFATSAGFLQVRENRALLLVGEAVGSDAIDAAEARTRLEAAEAAVEAAGEDDVENGAPRAGVRRSPGHRQRVMHKRCQAPFMHRSGPRRALGSRGSPAPPAMRSATSCPSAKPGTLPTPL